MSVIWGLVIVIAGLVGWLGQVLSAVAPATAVRLGMTDPEHTVDPAIHADARGEAWWDAASGWVLPLAGLLLIMDNEWWPHLALVGCGMYLYLTGRAIATRLALRTRDVRVGTDAAVRMLYITMTAWATIAVITMIAAVGTLGVPGA